MTLAGIGRQANRFLAGLAFAALVSAPGMAHVPIWIFPPRTANGQDLRSMSANPDAWAQTRARIDGLGYVDQAIKNQFSDAELQTIFAQMSQWHLKLELAAGAIKEWGTTADVSFPKGARTWDRLMRDGAHIDRISMDEPLLCALRHINEDTDFAIEQTARYVAFVRQRYPAIQIGDIEPYPSFPTPQLLAFIDGVQDRLRHWHVRGLDFFRLDVNWVHFLLHDELGREGWAGVRDIETAMRVRGIPFQLIYWAANYPALARAGEATDETWETEIMQQGAAYQAAGGAPDEMVIDSWLQEMVLPAIPETSPGTFTRSVLDFANQFNPGIPPRR